MGIFSNNDRIKEYERIDTYHGCFDFLKEFIETKFSELSDTFGFKKFGIVKKKERVLEIIESIAKEMDAFFVSIRLDKWWVKSVWEERKHTVGLFDENERIKEYNDMKMDPVGRIHESSKEMKRPKIGGVISLENKKISRTIRKPPTLRSMTIEQIKINRARTTILYLLDQLEERFHVFLSQWDIRPESPKEKIEMYKEDIGPKLGMIEAISKELDALFVSLGFGKEWVRLVIKERK